MALANKMARIIWAVMVRQTSFREAAVTGLTSRTNRSASGGLRGKGANGRRQSTDRDGADLADQWDTDPADLIEIPTSRSHLGQRSPDRTSKGRTHDRKRPPTSTSLSPCERGGHPHMIRHPRRRHWD